MEKTMSSKQPTAKAAKSAPKPGDSNLGYKAQHLEGSRKGKVHELFDKQGPEAAWTLGLKLGLKEGTLRSWFGTWRRETEQRKPSVMAAT